MLKEFISFSREENLFGKEDSVLIAVSGGMDSVVLLHLFSRLRNEHHDFSSLKLGIAHCNFNLRESESDSEEVFVKELAAKMDIPFFVKHFDTKAFADDNKISIQMAARSLRYNWFEAVRKENGYHHIAVAHHSNDIVETVLINLIKGTGIAGLHGIAARNGNIIRPLLFTSREAINTYIIENKISYKEDSSNSSTKYIRNKIRHNIIPVLKELNAGLEKTFSQNIERIKDVESIFKTFVEEKRKEITKAEGQKLFIDIEKLRVQPGLPALLYELLKPYNFQSGIIEDILGSLDRQSGKLFYSDTHRLLKDRSSLILIPLEETLTEQLIKIERDQQANTIGISLLLETKPNTPDLTIPTDTVYAYLDSDKLIFPLTLRKWQAGDWFKPLGMNGKKKISDYLIDEKTPFTEKENTWVLQSGQDIAWLVGQRIDNRYKITSDTNTIYILKVDSSS